MALKESRRSCRQYNVHLGHADDANPKGFLDALKDDVTVACFAKDGCRYAGKQRRAMRLRFTFELGQ